LEAVNTKIAGQPATEVVMATKMRNMRI
jgi:hypothetical protein